MAAAASPRKASARRLGLKVISALLCCIGLKRRLRTLAKMCSLPALICGHKHNGKQNQRLMQGLTTDLALQLKTKARFVCG